eukprot:GSMAST32.ASY1.ANO1.356.1 assembled CDS
MKCLDENFISKSSAKQRQGRAGRKCFRMYPKSAYNRFFEFPIPEILRVPLEEICLQILANSMGCTLTDIGAISICEEEMFESNSQFVDKHWVKLDKSFCKLLPLGKQLAVLPVDPKIGKMYVLFFFKFEFFFYKNFV